MSRKWGSLCASTQIHCRYAARQQEFWKRGRFYIMAWNFAHFCINSTSSMQLLCLFVNLFPEIIINRHPSCDGGLGCGLMSRSLTAPFEMEVSEGWHEESGLYFQCGRELLSRNLMELSRMDTWAGVGMKIRVTHAVLDELILFHRFSSTQ